MDNTDALSRFRCRERQLNKRLRRSYYFVEANYWRTQSIARPLCNSRARPTCFTTEPDDCHIRRCD